MDADKFKRLPRKAVSIDSVRVVKVDYLDKNFRLALNDGQKVTSTGFLEIATLKSSAEEFRFRWDEKDSSIDIEMRMAHSEEWLKKGFTGHHAEQLTNLPNRQYLVNIIVGSSPVFKGTVGLTVLTINHIKKTLRYEIKNNYDVSNLETTAFN